jgi:hypothetical protein
LNYQREISGKEYPFSAKYEIELYKKIAIFEENTGRYISPIAFDSEPLEVVYERVIQRIQLIFKYLEIEFPGKGTV